MLRAVALDYDDIVSQAAEENTQLQYDGNTRKAQDLSVFGAPSFSVGKEMFWGDNRLEDAIRFADKEKQTTITGRVRQLLYRPPDLIWLTKYQHSLRPNNFCPEHDHPWLVLQIFFYSKNCSYALQLALALA